MHDLRQRRARLRVTLRELAEHTGLTPSRLSQIERFPDGCDEHTTLAFWDGVDGTSGCGEMPVPAIAAPTEEERRAVEDALRELETRDEEE